MHKRKEEVSNWNIDNQDPFIHRNYSFNILLIIYLVQYYTVHQGTLPCGIYRTGTMDPFDRDVSGAHELFVLCGLSILSMYI